MQRIYSPELLDTPSAGVSDAELRENLGHIRLVNRMLGGTCVSMKHIRMLAAGRDSLSLLDIGTGTADIPLAVAKWGRSAGVGIRTVCLDISEAILGEAMRHAGHDPSVSFVRADGLMLPFPDRSFDIAHSSQTLHHLTGEDAALFIREMARVSRLGFVLNDLVRSRVSKMLITAITRMTTQNRLTRHDAPMSVARAFAPRELSDVARRAGLSGFSVHTHRFWRMALVGCAS